MIPHGIWCSTNSPAPVSTVWPALAPPWYRTTRSARSASTSTILPLPSSPHWAPTTTTQWFLGPNINHPPIKKPPGGAPVSSGGSYEIIERASTQRAGHDLSHFRHPRERQTSRNVARGVNHTGGVQIPPYDGDALRGALRERDPVDHHGHEARGPHAQRRRYRLPHRPPAMLDHPRT